MTKITIETNPENPEYGLIVRHDPVATRAERDAMWDRIERAIITKFPDNRIKGGVIQNNGVTFVNLRFGR